MAAPGSQASAELMSAQADEMPSSDGLSSAEAASRLAKYGRNELLDEAKPAWRLYAEQFVEPMPLVIWVAIVIELALAIRYGDAWPDFGVLMALQFGNCTLSFYEANKAGNAVAALKKSLKPSALAKRDGKWAHLEAALLVPGDLVKLDAGSFVPADVEILGEGVVSVDQASLTGESLPVTMRGPGSTNAHGPTPLAEIHVGAQPKMGSSVVRGEAEAVVMATGASTFLGKTAALIGSVDETPRFQKVLTRIMLFLIVIAIVLCLSILAFLIITEKQTFASAIATTVVLIVVSVPLAAEVVTTATMALGSLGLSKEGAIVARLRSIEELAGMDMLCSDKTGTLTQNKMALFVSKPPLPSPFYEEGLTQEALLEYAACATRWSEPAKDALDKLVLGAVAEGAMDGYESLAFVPFDPRHKRTEGTVRRRATGESFSVTKGAPHVLTSMLPVEDEETRATVLKAVDDFAARGIRVLAVAKTVDAPAAEAGGEKRWRMLGLLTFLDPPRPDTKETLRRAFELGVQCKMVTGDNVLIAKEMARQLGLGENILLATNLPMLDKDGQPPSDLGKYIPYIMAADGFAQVFPEHKFLIVEALRRQGFSVGMTGDGVNDSPALKRADIGIAVEGATDAARAAADIVFTQPGLSTIVSAIEAARAICVRIKAFIIYRVACTLQIVTFFFIAIISFQPSRYALGDFGATENVILALFGNGGRPEGALTMWHSNRCSQQTIPLSGIEAAVGQWSTGVSAAMLQQQATVHGSPAYRLTHGTGVVVDAAANSVTGRICLEQVPRTFILPLLALIIITILNDGTIISIAYDHVLPSQRPEVWRLPRLFLISIVLGTVALGSSLLLLHILLGSHSPDSVWQRLGFSPLLYGQVAAGMYLKVSLSDFLTLFCARTRGWACGLKSAFPSWQLLLAAFIALASSTTLAAHWPHALDGRPMSREYLPKSNLQQAEAVYKISGNRMDGADADLLVFTWLYCALFFVVMDLTKLALYRVLAVVDAREERRKAAAALGAVVASSGPISGAVTEAGAAAS